MNCRPFDQTQSLVAGQYFHRMLTLGMRWRAALTAAVFDKALRLSPTARADTTVGEVPISTIIIIIIIIVHFSRS